MKYTKFKILCTYAQCEQVIPSKLGSLCQIPQHFFVIYQNRHQIPNTNLEIYEICIYAQCEQTFSLILSLVDKILPHSFIIFQNRHRIPNTNFET